MGKRFAIVLTVLLLVSATAAWSLPLNGYNELINPGFETGDLTGWQAGADIEVAIDGTNGLSATCKNPDGDLWLRQIADDSLSPGWLPNGTAKYIDLMAEITWSGFVPQDSSVSFRLDWWDERYNGECNPTLLPYYFGQPPAAGDPALGYYVSEWVTIPLAGAPALQWQVVNPFNRILLPIQPRWVSVEMTYVQPAGVSVWVDNVNLTGQCVPEPSSLLVLLGGIAPLAFGRRFIRRR